MFIHKTPESKTIRQQEKVEIYYAQGRHRRETQSIFTCAACSFTYWKYTDEATNIASDGDIMENNFIFDVLWNLSVISHLIFPQCFIFISDAKSKNNLRGYVAFKGNTIIFFFFPCNFMILNNL